MVLAIIAFIGSIITNVAAQPGIAPAPPGYGSLRAPLPAGVVPDDGLFIIGGLATSGRDIFLTQYVPIFSDALNSALGAKLNKTFVTVDLDFSTTYTAVEGKKIDMIFTSKSFIFIKLFRPTCFSLVYFPFTLV